MRVLRTKWLVGLIFGIGATLNLPVVAGDVEIVEAAFASGGENQWRVSVTLKHADAGWEHYADGWRVVDESGKVFGHRTLHHPHVNEQPFTRSLGGILIPAVTTRVFVEAHDSVHDWAKERVEVDLSRNSGVRYTVTR